MKEEKVPVIRSIVPEDKEMVTAFFDQMGGESRSFFDRRGAIGTV